MNLVLNRYLREYQVKLRSRIAHLTDVQASSTVSTRDKTTARKEFDKLTKTLHECEEWERQIVLPLPTADVWTYRDRRFAFGKGIVPTPNVKVFNSGELGLGGELSVASPRSLGRFPLSGSGKRYVHGGISLQEIVVPAVKIHKARTDDTGPVEVELLRVPAKITTGQVAISLFQSKPAIDKILPRTLRVGVYSKDGKELSELKTFTFDSKQTEARQREVGMLITLSHAADAFNNQEVDLRLEETVPGTNQTVTYKTHPLRLQKPFASDFDEL
jgi:hypothetical protein